MNSKFEKYYNLKVVPVIDSSVKVNIDDETMEKIRIHAEKRAEYKKREYDHIIDHDREVERTITGLIGEAAVEKLLGVSVIDWTIGESSRYNVPDIKGYKVGVKTVERGKYPIIFKENWYPQLICVRDVKEKNAVYICGLADTDVLNTYQSDELILNKNLRAKGYKTGFFGFEHLKRVNNLSDIISK